MMTVNLVLHAYNPEEERPEAVFEEHEIDMSRNGREISVVLRFVVMEGGNDTRVLPHNCNIKLHRAQIKAIVDINDECAAFLDFKTHRRLLEPPEPILSVHYDLQRAIDQINDVTRFTAPWWGGAHLGYLQFWFSVSGTDDAVQPADLVPLEDIDADRRAQVEADRRARMVGVNRWPYHVPAPSGYTPIMPRIKHYNPKDYIAIITRQCATPVEFLSGFDRLNVRGEPRRGWAEIATVAEIAIKDFLVRWDKGSRVLSALLDKLPSPPVPQMYGRVLTAAIGEPSPMVKGLDEGAQIRNLIVHNPTATMHIPSKMFDGYRSAVMTALLHLMCKLYPGNAELKEQLDGYLQAWGEPPRDKAKNPSKGDPKSRLDEWLKECRDWKKAVEEKKPRHE